MAGLFLLKMLHFRIRDYIAVSSKELAGKFSEQAGWVPERMQYGLVQGPVYVCSVESGSAITIHLRRP